MAPRLISVLVVVLSLFLNPAAAHDGNVDRLLNLAEKAFITRKYDEAVKYLTEVIALRPKDSVAYWQRGYIYYLIGKNIFALNDLNRAIQINPKDPNPYMTRGMLRFSEDDFEGALADYAVANLFAPNHLYIIIYKANAYVKLGRYSQAIRHYNQAIDRITGIVKGLIKNPYVHRVGNKDKAIVLSGRGRAYYFLKKYQRARADLDRAVKLAPNYPLTYFFRSELFRKMGLRKQADADYARFKKMLKKRNLAPKRNFPLGMEMIWLSERSLFSFQPCLISFPV